MLTLLLIAAIVLVALAVVLGMAEPLVPTPQDEQLRLDAAPGAAATTQTASTNSPGLDLGAGFAPGGIGQPMAGIVNVTACDRANSDETYNLLLQESSDNASWSNCSAAIAVTVAGAVATLGVYVLKAVVSKRYVRLSTTIGGTTPSITFKAWLNPRKVS